MTTTSDIGNQSCIPLFGYRHARNRAHLLRTWYTQRRKSQKSSNSRTTKNGLVSLASAAVTTLVVGCKILLLKTITDHSRNVQARHFASTETSTTRNASKITSSKPLLQMHTHQRIQGTRLNIEDFAHVISTETVRGIRQLEYDLNTAPSYERLSCRRPSAVPDVPKGEFCNGFIGKRPPQDAEDTIVLCPKWRVNRCTGRDGTVPIEQ